MSDPSTLSLSSSSPSSPSSPKTSNNPHASYTSALVDIMRRTGALRTSDKKEFKLASGAMSDHYFDLRLLCGDPDGIGMVASAMYDMITSNDNNNYNNIVPGAVGGLESGSISIATAISHLSGQRHGANPARNPRLSSFFVRKNRKEHGTQKMIEGVISDVVVVVDDVITSGGSALKAVQAVRDAGSTCERLLCIVYRGSAEQEKLINETVHLDCLLRADDVLGRGKAS